MEKNKRFGHYGGFHLELLIFPFKQILLLQMSALIQVIVRVCIFQSQKSFKAGNENDEVNCITCLEVCATVVQNWMNGNRFKLNNEKTEFIKFTNSVHRNKCITDGLNIDTEHISENEQIKYLGVIFDNVLSFQTFVNEKFTCVSEK